MSNSIFRKDGTAQGVAKQRLIESLAQPENRLIYDPYAENFVFGSGIVKLMGHKLSVWITKKFIPGLHEHLISRTRFIDDLIEKFANNIPVISVLEGGYDMKGLYNGLNNHLKVLQGYSNEFLVNEYFETNSKNKFEEIEIYPPRFIELFCAIQKCSSNKEILKIADYGGG